MSQKILKNRCFSWNSVTVFEALYKTDDMSKERLFKIFDEALVSKIKILDPKEKSVFGEDEVFKCCVFRNKMNLWVFRCTV